MTKFDDSVNALLQEVEQAERSELDGATRAELEHWEAETNKPADDQEMQQFYNDIVEDM